MVHPPIELRHVTSKWSELQMKKDPVGGRVIFMFDNLDIIWAVIYHTPFPNGFRRIPSRFVRPTGGRRPGVDLSQTGPGQSIFVPGSKPFWFRWNWIFWIRFERNWLIRWVQPAGHLNQMWINRIGISGIFQPHHSIVRPLPPTISPGIPNPGPGFPGPQL